MQGVGGSSPPGSTNLGGFEDQNVTRRAGAQVVQVAAQGYGNALRGGIDAARGEYVLVGDADDSYDFSQMYPFVEQLR